MKLSRRRNEAWLLVAPALVLATVGAFVRARENANAALPPGLTVKSCRWKVVRWPGTKKDRVRLTIDVGWRGVKPAWWEQKMTINTRNPQLAACGQIVAVRPAGAVGGYYDAWRDVYRTGLYLDPVLLAGTPCEQTLTGEIVMSVPGVPYQMYQIKARTPFTVHFNHDDF